MSSHHYKESPLCSVCGGPPDDARHKAVTIEVEPRGGQGERVVVCEGNLVGFYTSVIGDHDAGGVVEFRLTKPSAIAPIALNGRPVRVIVQPVERRAGQTPPRQVAGRMMYGRYDGLKLDECEDQREGRGTSTQEIP